MELALYNDTILQIKLEEIGRGIQYRRSQGIFGRRMRISIRYNLEVAGCPKNPIHRR
jgi:hypothetical protein